MIGWDGADPKGLRAWEWGEAKQLLELAEILRNNFDFPGEYGNIKCGRIIREDEGNSEVIRVTIMHIFVTKCLLETRSRNKLDIKADSMLCQDHCNLNFPFLPKKLETSHF